jgi:hypothetical protein
MGAAGLVIGSGHLGRHIHGSTFRLTLAAALLDPALAREDGTLDEEIEARLTAWMRSHLEVAVHRFTEREPLGDLEECVLAEMDPPLNIGGRKETPLRETLTLRRKRFAKRKRKRRGSP